MALFAKVGGAFKAPSFIYGNVGGTYRHIYGVWVNVLGVWRLSWKAEVLVTLTSRGDSPVLSSFFSQAEWTDPYLQKRVVIPTGHEIGGNNHNYVIALSSWADGAAGSFHGTLILDNYGTISGVGGVQNSGEGGHVINLPFGGNAGQRFIINNYGTIRAGGGGGGRGGDGGGGYWDEAYTYNEGWQYSRSYYGYITNNAGWWWTWYAGTHYGSISDTFESGGWTYLRGAYAEGWSEGRESRSGYYISRQQTRYTRRYTSGGVGGTGGRGYGYDAPWTGEGGGGAPGTNAGWGGNGGHGGNWGQNGNSGYRGGWGNNTGDGAWGAAGGLAGAYLVGSQFATLNNYGTVLGRLL